MTAMMRQKYQRNRCENTDGTTDSRMVRNMEKNTDSGMDSSTERTLQRIRFGRTGNSLRLLAVCLCMIAFLTACGGKEEPAFQGGSSNHGQSSGLEGGTLSLEDIPEYSGVPYVEVNGNEPEFQEADMTQDAFEEYSDLDFRGRCGTAFANIGQELMPTKKRESISAVKPSGWKTAKYDIVDGKYLYNRCHLIGYQLTAENANEKNLITGTRYMNVDGMLPFENMVADYVKETDYHVLYRVTPVFSDRDLVAEGVQMEAYSVEDEGDGICFNVFVYNVQPGIEIDYADGDSQMAENASWEIAQAENASDANGIAKGAMKIAERIQGLADGAKRIAGAAQGVMDVVQGWWGEEGEIRGNRSSKIYHCPGQANYDDMADSPNLVLFDSEQEARDAGYRKAKR